MSTYKDELGREKEEKEDVSKMKGFEIKQVQMRPPRFLVDKGSNITFCTGEMRKEIQMSILENSGSLGTLIYIPEEAQNAPPKLDVSSFEGKKPSERLYNVIYIYYQQQGGKEKLGDYQLYYNNQIEKFIDFIKNKLDN